MLVVEDNCDYPKEKDDSFVEQKLNVSHMDMSNVSRFDGHRECENLDLHTENAKLNCHLPIKITFKDLNFSVSETKKKSCGKAF